MAKKYIASALVLAAAAGFAAAPSAQVYNMTINVKTTECKQGTVNTFCVQDDTYRKQASTKIEGLFWGCHCPTIAAPEKFASFVDLDVGQDGSHGYVFWNKEKQPLDAEFAWENGLLHRIDKKANKCEGVWTLTLNEDGEDGETVFDFRGAGFGSVKELEKENADFTVISSMSGNFAGWALPGAIKWGCAVCAEVEQGCAAWNLCDCEDLTSDNSAAYGTWSLKYNSSASKKYNNGGDILAAYKFSDSVKSFLNKINSEEEDSSDVEQKPTDSTVAAYAAAKEAFAAAEKALDDVTAKFSALYKNVKFDADGLFWTWTTVTDIYTETTNGKLLDRNLDDATEDFEDARGDFTAATTAANGNVNVAPYVTAVESNNVLQAAIDANNVIIATSSAPAAITNAKKANEALEAAQVDVAIAKQNALNAIEKIADADAKEAANKLVADYDTALKALESAKDAYKTAATAYELWAGFEDLVFDFEKVAKPYYTGTTAVADAAATQGTYANATSVVGGMAPDAARNYRRAEEDLRDAKLACTITGAVCK